MTDPHESFAHPAAYWKRLHAIAISGDPDLALAHHLLNEHRRFYDWYPYDEVWRRSDAYQSAVAMFELRVLAATDLAVDVDP
jgi:hypothetical protein